MKPHCVPVEELETRVRLGEEPNCHGCGRLLYVDYIWTGAMRVYCINDECTLHRLMSVRA